jgi:hypothetical protein
MEAQMAKVSIGHVSTRSDMSARRVPSRGNPDSKTLSFKKPARLSAAPTSANRWDKEDEKILAELRAHERALWKHSDSIEAFAGSLYDLNIGLGFDPRTLWGDEFMSRDIEGARQRLSQGRDCIVRAWERASQQVWQWEQ